MTSDPQDSGSPDLGSLAWDPFWDVCEDLQLPVHFHIGASQTSLSYFGTTYWPSQDEYVKPAIGGASLFQNNSRLLLNSAYSGMFDRHPNLKMVSVESGIGWIPFMLETMDYQFQGNSVAEERPEFDRLPSEYFARNVYACYWFEQTAPRRLLDKIGVDNILFETDFPHPTSLYGDEVHARIKAGLADCEESARHKILWGNAEKLYKVIAPSAKDEAALAARGA
jgi:predicted TIM-barrel fold metal-dependent hydrolase